MRRSVLSSFIALLLVGTVAAPAGAEEDPDRKRPGKPAGEISSFEDPTLTIELRDGATWSGDVACDVKVGVARRRVRSRGRGHVNIARGSTADLQPGAWVLRLKVEEGLIHKILIRKAPEETTRTSSGEDEGTESAESREGKDQAREDARLADKESARGDARRGSTEDNCTEADEADADESAENDSENTEDGDKTDSDTDTKDDSEDRTGDESNEEPVDDCPEAVLDEILCGTG